MVKIARKGKYQEWVEPDGLLRVEGWARDGLTDEQIAHNIGICYETLRTWAKTFPAFSEALKKGKAPVDIEVENALLKRALGFEYEEVTTEIYELPDGGKRKQVKKTRKMVVPDTAAAFIWLKNRRPDKWRDRRETGIEASDEALQRAREILGGIDSAVK